MTRSGRRVLIVVVVTVGVFWGSARRLGICFGLGLGFCFGASGCRRVSQIASDMEQILTFRRRDDRRVLFINQRGRLGVCLRFGFTVSCWRRAVRLLIKCNMDQAVTHVEEEVG